MTGYDQDWAARETARRTRMAEHSLYAPEDERASCGVGLVVSVDGKPSRRVVEAGIEALKAVWHRGAVDADGKTGDGAGIHLQIPASFFYDQIKRTGHEPHYDQLMAVGQVFPAAHRFRRTGNMPHHLRDRNSAHGPYHLWLAACAGGHHLSGREGQRHPARD